MYREKRLEIEPYRSRNTHERAQLNNNLNWTRQSLSMLPLPYMPRIPRWTFDPISLQIYITLNEPPSFTRQLSGRTEGSAEELTTALNEVAR